MKLAMGVKFTGGSVVITRVREEEVVQLRRRRGALKLVDRHLSKNNYKLALSLLKQSSLSGFAAATQVTFTYLFIYITCNCHSGFILNLFIYLFIGASKSFISRPLTSYCSSIIT